MDDNQRYVVAIIRCDGCGRIGLSLDDQENGVGERLTSHKCGDSFATVESAELPPEFFEAIRQSERARCTKAVREVMSALRSWCDTAARKSGCVVQVPENAFSKMIASLESVERPK